MSSGVNIIGFKEFQAKLKALPNDLQAKADLFVQDAGLEWEGRAKRSAPIDKGGGAGLVGNIVYEKKGNMQAEITSAKLYSPYVEWGTGTRVSVPVELQSYAIQFKGKKKVVGRFPKPYFFIHKEPIRKELYEKLNKLLNTTR